MPFWRLQECPQLPMTAARDQLHPTISKTRNRFVLNRAHGFESHHLSRKKSTGSGWCFFVSNRISPSFKKYVSIIFAQSLLKRIDNMNCRFTARTRSPLTPLPPVRHSLLFPVAGTYSIRKRTHTCLKTETVFLSGNSSFATHFSLLR